MKNLTETTGPGPGGGPALPDLFARPQHGPAEGRGSPAALGRRRRRHDRRPREGRENADDPPQCRRPGIARAAARHGVFVFDVPYRDSVSVLRRVTETVKRQTGIPFHLHLLRHAFASRLLAAGVDIVTVSSLLGHGARMTTLLYAHSSIDQMRKAVDTLPGHRAMDVSPESRLRN
jgi:integrase